MPKNKNRDNNLKNYFKPSMNSIWEILLGIILISFIFMDLKNISIDFISSINNVFGFSIIFIIIIILLCTNRFILGALLIICFIKFINNSNKYNPIRISMPNYKLNDNNNINNVYKNNNESSISQLADIKSKNNNLTSMTYNNSSLEQEIINNIQSIKYNSVNEANSNTPVSVYYGKSKDIIGEEFNTNSD